MDHAYPCGAVIVDPEPRANARSAGWLLMPLAIGALTLAFGALLLRPPDPDSAARARARLLAALPTAAATAMPSAVPAGRTAGPSVLAMRTPRPSLPPPLALPGEVATTVPAGTADAARAIILTASATAPPSVYRIADGRLFVVQQMPSNRGRPILASYQFEEAIVRGFPAQLFTLARGPLRAMVWWTEGPASYYVYSGTLSLRELVRLSELLR